MHSQRSTKYDVGERVISAFVVGLLEDMEAEDGKTNMKAFFHYNMQNGTDLIL